MELEGKRAVVTGGGSGIGRALCHELATRGAAVAVCDLDLGSAEETVKGLPAASQAQHAAFAVDVADAESMDRLASDTIDSLGSVDILVNNAGVLGRMAPFEEVTLEELRWVIGIDLWGPIHGCRSFLPHLKTRPTAAIANVSSAAGLLGSLGNAAYYAAKFGVRGFTENLRADLHSTSVKVTAVYPGVVKTNLGASGWGYTDEEKAEATRRYHTQPGISPERAARKIARAIERGKPRALIGPDVWALDKLARLMPASSGRLLHPVVVRLANRQRVDGRNAFR